MVNITANTILLVEDNPNDVLLINRAFSKANLNTRLQVVTDGDAAVSYLSGEGIYVDRDRYPVPTLILLDLKLPCRSGHEVLEWQRQQPGLKHLPVVILTSSNESADLKRAYALGVNSYLLKPVGFQALIEMVKTLNLYWLTLNQPPVLDE